MCKRTGFHNELDGLVFKQNSTKESVTNIEKYNRTYKQKEKELNESCIDGDQKEVSRIYG